MSIPLVSVVIPAYNAEKYLSVTLDSVVSQTFADWELIIVDDGSKDRTEELVAARLSDKRIKYFYRANGGVSKARNFGMSQATGKYIAFLDADDVWEPIKLEKQVRMLDFDADAKACYSAFSLVDDNLKPLGINRSERVSNALEDLLLIGNVIGTPSTVVVERKLFTKIGGFDSDLSLCADWEMWVRLATQTDFLLIDRPLIKYRVHDGNMSNNVYLLETDTLRLLKKSFSLPNIPARILRSKNKVYAKNYMIFAGSYFQTRRYLDFLRCAFRSLKLDLSQCKYLFEFPLRKLRQSMGLSR